MKNDIDPLYKDIYGPAIREELNSFNPILQKFEKAQDMQFEGRQIIEAVEVQRAGGFYYTAEGGPIPTAVPPQLEYLRITPRYGYGQVSLTEQEIQSSRTNKGAFARAQRLKMDSMLSRVKKERNRILWGDGRGVLALVNGAANSATQTVDAPGGIAGSVNGSRYLQPKTWIGFVNTTTGAIGVTTTYQIDTIPAAGTTITLTAAANTTDNWAIVAAYGNDATAALTDLSYNQEPMGLSGMVDNGTLVNLYFDLSRTTFPIMQATLFTAVGALSADIVQRAVDVNTQLAGKGVTEHIMHPSVRRAYLAISENDRRYTLGKLMNPDVGTNIAKGGYSNGLDFGGVPISIDHDAPFGEWFGMNWDNAYRYPVDEGNWIDRDGSVLYRSTTAVDTFDATWRIHDNFCHLRPNSCFKLTGITANVVTVHVY